MAEGARRGIAGVAVCPVVLVGLASIAAGLVVAWVVPGAENDFVYDWLTASAFVQGVDPYRPLGDLAEQFGLVNPAPPEFIHARTPGALLLQSPIGLVSYGWSYELGRALTVASAFLLAWVVARLTGLRTEFTLAAVPVLLFVWPFSRTLMFSQSGFLIGALLGLTWLMGDRWSAGLPLALAVTLKLWPWLLIPALWLSSRRRAALGAAIGFGALNLAGLAFPHVAPDGLARMLSGAAAFKTATITGILDLPIVAGAAIALGLLVLLSYSVRNLYAWGIALALLFAPFVWVHYLPVLVIPFVLALGAMSKTPSETPVIGDLPLAS